MNKDIVKPKKLLLDSGFYILLILFIIIFGIISPVFITFANIFQILISSSFLLAAASGLTIVIISGNMDLSIGSVAYLSSGIVALTSNVLPPIFAILFGLIVGIVVGLINGLLVAQFKMNSMLTTLGLMIVYRGISLVITGGGQVFSDPIIKAWGSQSIFSLPIIFIIAIILMLTLQAFLKKTKIGMHIYAIGCNISAAKKIGIPIKRTVLLSFVISSVCAAISGILILLRVGECATYVGNGMEFDAVAAIVIGGTSLFGGKGNILPKTLSGVLLMYVINNGLGTMGVSPYIYPIIKGAVIFIAMYIDSLKNKYKLS